MGTRVLGLAAALATFIMLLGCRGPESSPGDGGYESSTIGSLKYVPAGRFQRDAGSTNISAISRPYRMSATEITRAQFLAVMGTDTVAADGVTEYSSGIADPVMSVNLYCAIAFCNKLSIMEGLIPAYAVAGVDFSALGYESIPKIDDATWNAATVDWAADGYRIPTEMEWMWAAMGAPADGQSGGTDTTGYMKGYSGSSEGSGQASIGSFAWYYDNSDGKTHPAGTKQANELGLYDMSGNVFEQCWDLYAGYPDGKLTDYRGAASGTDRVARGGCYLYNANPVCTVACRYYYPWGSGQILSGIRVVRP
jgi:formylglycine-generating enzyme required for sulfatase activity